MKDNDVEFFSTLLGLDAEVVRGASEEGTLGQRIKDHGLVSKSELDTLKENLTRDVKTSYMNELIDKTKKGETPKELYDAIRFNVTEKLEKQIASELGITDYRGMDDLLSKVITNKVKGSDDKAIEELSTKIKQLQDANIKLESDKEEIIERLTKEKSDWILNREKSDLIANVPFDLSDVEQKDLDEVTKERRGILSDVFDAKYSLGFKDDKITVFNKDGNPLLNEVTYEPVPVSDVLRKTAVAIGQKLKSPESGGQGGNSSGSTSAKFKSYDEAFNFLTKKGIVPTSKEGLEIINKRGVES